MRLLCVCRGNLCRSPMAAATLRAKIHAAGLGVIVDSAGTATWHTGDPADPEALATLARRGYQLEQHRARRLREDDFRTADMMLAMDSANLTTLRRTQPDDTVALIEPFHPMHDVFDPYYGGRPDFEAALDIIEEGADILVSRLVSAAETTAEAIRPRLSQRVRPLLMPPPPPSPSSSSSRRSGSDGRGDLL